MDTLQRLGFMILRDGSMIRIALVRPEDRSRILRFLHSLSPETKSLRFLSASVDVDSEADVMSDVDGHDRVALIATTASGDAVIGHALWARTDLGRAEAAVVVADGYQRRGIGSLLLRMLAENASIRGIRTFEGTCAPQNHAILACVDGSFRMTVRRGPGGMQIEFATHPVEPHERPQHAAA